MDFSGVNPAFLSFGEVSGYDDADGVFGSFLMVLVVMLRDEGVWWGLDRRRQ